MTVRLFLASACAFDARAAGRVAASAKESLNEPFSLPRPAAGHRAGHHRLCTCRRRIRRRTGRQQGTGSTDPGQPGQVDPALPVAIVHKTASCGCCGIWVDHLKAAGFQVDVRDTDDMNPIKVRLGVPVGKASCHTAEIGGYVVEGHIPAEDISACWPNARPHAGWCCPACRPVRRHGNAGWLRAVVHRRAGADRRQHRAVCPARAGWLMEGGCRSS